MATMILAARHVRGARRAVQDRLHLMLIRGRSCRRRFVVIAGVASVTAGCLDHPGPAGVDGLLAVGGTVDDLIANAATDNPWIVVTVDVVNGDGAAVIHNEYGVRASVLREFLDGTGIETESVGGNNGDDVCRHA